MIKPLFNHTVHIQNLHSYRDCIKKRPKNPQKFRFSAIQNQQDSNPALEKKIQLKLLKTLKTVKPITKLNLEEYVVTNYDYCKARFLAACKRCSHVKTFSMMSAKSSSKIKCFRYFPRLKNLLYKLNNDYLLSQKEEDEDASDTDDKPLPAFDYLQYLKYCPQIRSVHFSDLSDESSSPTIVFKPHLYHEFLESLTLKSEDDFEFPIESCKNLKSLSFQSPNFKILESLVKLPNLQEIDLSGLTGQTSSLLKSLAIIGQEGVLKKVKLGFKSDCNEDTPCLEKILKCLKPCNLTHFSLKADIQKGLLRNLSQFVDNMSSLESVEFHILNEELFSEHDDFLQMCKSINKLRGLQNLKLHFETSEKFAKGQRISNFIPFLAGAFTKLIKIRTFHLECNQINASEILQSLISVLGNSIASLTHLRLDFGALTCTKKTYDSILELMQNLSNIQVLEIPCLSVSSPTIKYLSEMVDNFHNLKYLRVLEIGSIKGTVSSTSFYKTVEAIAMKRGLRKFGCSLSNDFVDNLEKENHTRFPNMKKIRARNPYLETIEGLDGYFGNKDWMEDLYKL